MMNWPNFSIHANWGSDGLSPKVIGEKTLATLDQLEPLSSAMTNWMLVDEIAQDGVPLAEMRTDMTAFVERNVNELDWGETPGAEGYTMIAIGSEIVSEERSSDAAHLMLTAGNVALNSAKFTIGAIDLPNNYSLITYPIFKGALEAIAANWPCPWLLAYTYNSEAAPVDAPDRGAEEGRSPFEVAWIAYLSPKLAAGLSPPDTLACERTAGGGVILSAIQGLIDQDNPDHMHRSRLLEAILEDRVGRDRQRAALLPARIGPY